MKNVLLALLFAFSFVNFSFASDCSNGVCRAPVRKTVEVAKNVIVAPVRAVTNVVSNVRSNRCCCDAATTYRNRPIVRSNRFSGCK